LALEFNKVVDQVYKLGRMLDEIDLNAGNRLDLALERFYEATDLDFIHKRVNMTRQPDVSGYRGAAPLDAPIHEVIAQTFPCPPIPSSATIVAADGSQIYPSEGSPLRYFLVNMGIFTYHHGADRVPDQYTTPRLFFHKDHVYDSTGRVLSNRTIDARRTAAEMQELSKQAWEWRGEARPLIALYDNHLLFWAGSEVTGYLELMRQYHGALVHLQDAGALLAGYVDNPTRSRVVIRLLHLLSLTEEEVHSTDLGSSRELEGVRDIQLFGSVLQPGERSALMVQNSPRNLKYRQRGEGYEIAFFYLKISSGYQESIARVDVPMWVARDKGLVNELHALLVSQCSLQGRNPYPYVLTRADELAHVSGRDKLKLDEMIAIELRKKGINPHPFSAKAWGKQLARSPKRQHEM
jgi:hypothetical protein